MKHRNLYSAIRGGALAAALVMGTAAPASADWHGRGDWNDRGYNRDWHDRGGHRGWHRDNPQWYYRHPYRHVVREEIYVAPPPVYTAPVYAAPGGVVCRTNYNPLPFVVGSVAGGAIGSGIGRGHGRTAAIISGALIGGLVGNQYGSYDRTCTQAVFETVPVGRTYSWQNPDTDYAYEVTPVRDYRAEGRYCREYQARADVGGRSRDTYGTACMQPDGSWQIVN